jgi:protease-4
MTVEIDTVLDRRRLRRRLTVWRTLAIAAVVAALFAFGVSGDKLASFGPKQIARVAIEGTITEDRQQLELLKRIADADSAAALLVFVNSPGGTTTGGEALFAALREVAKKKPVVAQFGTVAASAGYIVGLGTDHIVTRANTITGSVGVLIQWPEVSQALDKLGVKFNEIKSGDLKAEQIPGLTRGRVFTGREAVALKLVDSIGGEEEAVECLRSKRNIDKSLKVVDWKPQTTASLGFFSSIGAAAASFFNHTYVGQMLARDPSLSGLGLDGLISVWHPSEK